MKPRIFWILFVISCAAWFLFALHSAPLRSGLDAVMFRDAGWNLATGGRYESAALVQMRDFTPRLYAHYTPIYPLLFATSLKIFPPGPYSGTLFNFFISCLATATLLFFTLRLPESKVRNLVAGMLTLLPTLAITYDRPEALGVVFLLLSVASATRRPYRGLLTGFLVALTFFTHPYLGLLAALWCAIFYQLQFTQQEKKFSYQSIQPFIATFSFAAMLVGSVAVIFYSLDHESLMRFLNHSFGPRSGLGAVANPLHNTPFLTSFYSGVVTKGTPLFFIYFAAIILHFAVALKSCKGSWLKEHSDRLVTTVALVVLVCSILLFPAQSQYILALSLITPALLFIAPGSSAALRRTALALLLFSLAAHLPQLLIYTLQQAELKPSYEASLEQPKFLLAHLSSPNAVVAVGSGSYDIYKPYLPNLIDLYQANEVEDFSKLEAVSVCYGGFPGEADELAPFPGRLDVRDYQLIQRAPMHQWITVFGHRVMRKQWGFGCDLYLRFKNQNPALSTEAKLTQAK